MEWEEAHLRCLEQARVAHLATADSQGQPHVVPVCFCLHAGSIYVALDQKPKRLPVERLKRVRNVLENPRVSLLLDHYSEDWSQLWFLLLSGRAHLGSLPAEVGPKLGRKYPQYQTMELDACLCIQPQTCTYWSP